MSTKVPTRFRNRRYPGDLRKNSPLHAALYHTSMIIQHTYKVQNLKVLHVDSIEESFQHFATQQYKATVEGTTMAFDYPIEADRVDNLNLFSVFLRAPVIGTVMWFISGGAAGKDEKEEIVVRDEGSLVDPAETLKPRPSPPPSPLRDLQVIEDDLLSHHRPFKRMPPRLIHSDISEIAENSVVTEAVSQYQSSSYNDTAPLSKKEKKMSWSDESGRLLVEYVGGQVSNYSQLSPLVMRFRNRWVVVVLIECVQYAMVAAKALVLGATEYWAACGRQSSVVI